jgi:protein SCO1/2
VSDVRRSITAGVLTAGLLLSACSVGAPPDDSGPVAGLSVQDDDGLNGAVLPTPYIASGVPLTDTEGAEQALDTVTADAGDELTLVFFGYTHCPDICQIVMADIASALTRLDDAERARVGMTFVTTDPARDDEATLRAYLDRFDPSFGGLTGPLPRIVEVGHSLGVAIEKGEKMPSGGYEVNHGTQVVGLLPDGTAPVVWTEGTGPERIAQDLQAILADGVPEVSGS